MSYTDLITKYPVNRALTAQERSDQLKQKQRLDVTPHYDLSVIRLNSTFAESVDNLYAERGTMTTYMLVFGCLFLYGCLSLLLFHDDVIEKLIGLFMGGPGVAFAFYVFYKTVFTYTHFPIRFNRKKRTVYVFRKDGTALKEKWDDIFFTLGRESTVWGNTFDVRGHVLDADRNTVLGTFSLAILGVNKSEIEPHWEFYRRYMEEGPKTAIGDLELICLPRLDLKRESFRFGWERLVINAKGFPWFGLLMLPFFTLFSFGRWLSMRASKIPQWPQWVEDECKIAPNDPFVKERSTNASDVRGG